MRQPMLPLIIEPEELERQLGKEGVLIVDLCKGELYAQSHIPGATHLDYPRIVAVRKPVMGLLPDDVQLNAVFSAIGLGQETHVVAYDDEGGGKAARLLWTLEACGHPHYSLLNGGLHAWANEGHPLGKEAPNITPSRYRIEARNETVIATRDYIAAHLGDPHVVLLDTRTPEEYCGAKRFAERGGHIPGAVNMDWVEAMDSARNLRIKDLRALRNRLGELGVSPDREIIVYCQTHHRSAFTFIVLKALGYPRVRGYPGSWSEWGNTADAPIER